MSLLPTTRPQKTLLHKFLIQQNLDVVNNVHLYFAGASIMQDTLDSIKDIVKPKMYAKKVVEDCSNYLGQVMRNMQELSGDDQLTTLHNNQCMKEILQKLIYHTRIGDVENVLNLILDYEKEL